MKQEDIKFLKELQQEMLTQDTVDQADPRFWVVMQTVRDYWVDDDFDGVCIYDTDAAENVFEGEFEDLAKWIKKEFDIVTKCEYEYGFIEIVCEDDKEYYTDDLSEIKDFFDEYGLESYTICYYRDRGEIAQDTMFLTLRECNEHIKVNSHYYNKTAHSCAMTALRSPQVERLYKILQETNWDDILIK